MTKKVGRKSLRYYRKSLSSAGMVQKLLERKTRLLIDLEIERNQILIFFNEKTFIVDPVFNK